MAWMIRKICRSFKQQDILNLPNVTKPNTSWYLSTEWQGVILAIQRVNLKSGIENTPYLPIITTQRHQQNSAVLQKNH